MTFTLTREQPSLVRADAAPTGLPRIDPKCFR
jgi:hypothetical protein